MLYSGPVGNPHRSFTLHHGLICFVFSRQMWAEKLEIVYLSTPQSNYLSPGEANGGHRETSHLESATFRFPLQRHSRFLDECRQGVAGAMVAPGWRAKRFRPRKRHFVTRVGSGSRIPDGFRIQTCRCNVVPFED